MAQKKRRSGAKAKTRMSAKTKTVVRKKAPAARAKAVQNQTPSSAQQKWGSVINLMEMKMNNNKQYDKITQDAAAFGQEQVEAFVKSSTIFAKGMEGVMKACMELAQSSAEKAQGAAKTMMTCKTINEITEAQSKFAQSSFDDFMNSMTKLSEMSVKLATESMEPINDQMGKVMKKAAQQQAA